MVGRSLAVGMVTTLLVVPAAYAFAYGLTRTRLPGKGLLRITALLPLLAPSLLPGIALVYLLGNQGLLKGLTGGATIYGFWGIVVGEAFYTFPHALMILLTGLALADGRLYDAARAMGAGHWRTFMTVTLPGTRYAVFSACCVVFTLTVTDFGVPKVVGGDYNVLAMEAYKAVVGQQNFSKGAAIGLMLLLPAVLTFVLDRRLRARQGAQMSGRAQPYAAGPNRRRDAAFLALACVMAALILLIVGVAVWASFVKMWPYNLSMSLRSYDFDNMDGGGWLAWRNSLELAFCTALLGTAAVFSGAWMMVPARGAAARGLRGLAGMLALMPMAVPGLVLGLGYLLLQQPVQSAEPAVRHHAAAGPVHHRALLHQRPPDRDHGAQRAGSGVRGRLGLAQGAAPDHVPARHAADVPARGAGRGPLPVRVRHDDGVRRGVPVQPQDRAGCGGGAEHG